MVVSERMVEGIREVQGEPDYALRRQKSEDGQ